MTEQEHVQEAHHRQYKLNEYSYDFQANQYLKFSYKLAKRRHVNCWIPVDVTEVPKEYRHRIERIINIKSKVPDERLPLEKSDYIVPTAAVRELFERYIRQPERQKEITATDRAEWLNILLSDLMYLENIAKEDRLFLLNNTIKFKDIKEEGHSYKYYKSEYDDEIILQYFIDYASYLNEIVAPIGAKEHAAPRNPKGSAERSLSGLNHWGELCHPHIKLLSLLSNYIIQGQGGSKQGILSEHKNKDERKYGFDSYHRAASTASKSNTSDNFSFADALDAVIKHNRYVKYSFDQSDRYTWTGKREEHEINKTYDELSEAGKSLYDTIQSLKSKPTPQNNKLAFSLKKELKLIEEPQTVGYSSKKEKKVYHAGNVVSNRVSELDFSDKKTVLHMIKRFASVYQEAFDNGDMDLCAILDEFRNDVNTIKWKLLHKDIIDAYYKYGDGTAQIDKLIAGYTGLKTGDMTKILRESIVKKICEFYKN